MSSMNSEIKDKAYHEELVRECWRREIATIFCREYLTNFCRR